MNEETGRVDNFRKAARLLTGPHKGRRFNDSDVYKSMEAAAYALRLRPDPVLEKTLDDLIALIARAQEPDGYLFTTRTNDPAHPAPGSGPERWSNLRVSHELYNVGHMYEAAVAHFQATGKRTFLAIAEKNAALLLRTFGAGPGQRRGFPGHQEIEIGLAKLYRATGNRAYLDLAKFFLDERGHYFGGERHAPDDPFAVYDSDEYLQNHKPVLEQDAAVGHAVRAMYMYSGMADVAALGGHPDYVSAIDRLWLDVAGRKQYLTGGVGARSGSEAFGDAYELPNAEAYTETCAAIGNALWNYRLFLLHGESRYMDVFERVLYNGLLSGVSLTGRPLLLPEPARIVRRLRPQPLVRGRLLSAQHDPLPALPPGLRLRDEGRRRLRQSLHRRLRLVRPRRPHGRDHPGDALPLGRRGQADGLSGQAPARSSWPSASPAGPAGKRCRRTFTGSWTPPSTRPSSRSTGNP